MEKEFVPYQIALDMKSIEFDEPCFGYYVLEKNGDYKLYDKCEVKTYFTYISAPLYQQAFRWFREKYDITQTIARDGSLAKEGRWAYTIIADLIYFNDGYFTYEEAESACLDKLIEICRKK
jgi:hypothetical protein